MPEGRLSGSALGHVHLENPMIDYDTGYRTCQAWCEECITMGHLIKVAGAGFFRAVCDAACCETLLLPVMSVTFDFRIPMSD